MDNIEMIKSLLKTVEEFTNLYQTYFIIGSAIVIVILASLFIMRSISKAYKAGYDARNKEWGEIIEKGVGRFGIVKKTYNTYHTFYVEIEQIVVAGNLTKVKIVSLSKDADMTASDQKLLEECDWNNWVLTTQIVWFDDNSQRLRESKLDTILNS